LVIQQQGARSKHPLPGLPLLRGGSYFDPIPYYPPTFLFPQHLSMLLACAAAGLVMIEQQRIARPLSLTAYTAYSYARHQNNCGSPLGVRVLYKEVISGWICCLLCCLFIKLI
jgi:hypothetical protein